MAKATSVIQIHPNFKKYYAAQFLLSGLCSVYYTMYLINMKLHLCNKEVCMHIRDILDKLYTPPYSIPFSFQFETGSLNKACLDSESADDAWRCFFTEYSYKYVKTPIFYVNSLYDYWGLWFILGIHCHPSQCPEEQISKLEEFHREYLDFAKQMRDHSTQNGMFVTSCYAHTQTLAEGYTENMIGGQTVQEAFGDWYFGRVDEGASFYFDCEDSYDCNPTCDWSLERYADYRPGTQECVL